MKFYTFYERPSLKVLHPRKLSNPFFYVFYDIAGTLLSPSDFTRYHSRRVNIFTVCISLSIVTVRLYSHEIAETTATGYTTETVSDRSWLSRDAICTTRARIIK